MVHSPLCAFRRFVIPDEAGAPPFNSGLAFARGWVQEKGRNRPPPTWRAGGKTVSPAPIQALCTASVYEAI